MDGVDGYVVAVDTGPVTPLVVALTYEIFPEIPDIGMESPDDPEREVVFE